MEDFLADAGLLEVLLGGVGVVGVDDQRHVLQTFGLVNIVQMLQLFEVVIGPGLAVVVDITTQDGMGQLVAGGVDLPAAVNEGVVVLGGHDGVEHHGQVAAGGVLHAHGDGNAAGGQAVLLILHAPGADSHIGQQVGEVAVIVGIQHLIGGGQAGVLQHVGVEAADGDDALQHVHILFGIGLVQQALVAVAGGAGLVGVDTGDQDQTVFHLLLQARQSLAVIHHRIFPVCGAGADDQHHLVALAGENVGDLLVTGGLDGGQLGGQGIPFLDLHGDGELSLEVHISHGRNLFICKLYTLYHAMGTIAITIFCLL